jgi:hypothetical protein
MFRNLLTHHQGVMSYICGAPRKARNLTSYIYMDKIFYWGFFFLNRAFR